MYRAEESDDAWTAAEHIEASVFDALNIANWQRSGGKGVGPDPLPRPSDAAQLRTKAERHSRQAKLARARQKARRESLAQG